MYCFYTSGARTNSNINLRISLPPTPPQPPQQHGSPRPHPDSKSHSLTEHPPPNPNTKHRLPSHPSTSKPNPTNPHSPPNLPLKPPPPPTGPRIHKLTNSHPDRRAEPCPNPRFHKRVISPRRTRHRLPRRLRPASSARRIRPHPILPRQPARDPPRQSRRRRLIPPSCGRERKGRIRT